MRNAPMVRTTLDLDDDVLLAAKVLAIARRTTAGKVVSDLATFDRTIPLGAVTGATRSTVAVVSAA
jgi:hypothetical protein